MGWFADMAADDAGETFADEDVFGESVMYQSKGSAVTSVSAIFHSTEHSPRQQDGGRTMGYDIVVSVRKAQVPTVTLNADSIRVPAVRLGRIGDPQWVRVAAILGGYDEADPMWKLGLGKGR